MPAPDHPPDANTELAKSRTRFAADRTLLAWIRTALSLISFGFGIPTIVRAISESRLGSQVNPHRFSTLVGLAFISVGVFAMAVSLIEHRRLLKNIQRDRLTYETSNTSEIVAMALILIGVVSFIGVLLRSISL